MYDYQFNSLTLKIQTKMKKRLLFVLTALLTASGMWAADGDTFTANTVEDVEMTFTVISEAEKTCLVGTGNWRTAISTSTTGTVTIPSEVNGYHVTAIDVLAFDDCWYLENIIIPEGVTTINGSAFSGCIALTSIIIPSTVTNIIGTPFPDCPQLSIIVVDEGNATYDSRNACNAIINSTTNELITGCKNTVIPNTVTGIGDGAFSYCDELTSINIPNSVTNIGVAAFLNCVGLTSINIPNSVTTIGRQAFYSSGLKSINIPNSVTTIGSEAFRCSGLTSITVEEGNTKYDSRENCNAIIKSETNELIQGCKNTKIPNTVTSIGEEAFCGNSPTSINIPNSVTNIGSKAFYLSDLVSITIPNSITTINDDTFSGCSDLTTISIPGSVTTIGNGAFYMCSSLTSITIPSGVTKLGYSVFGECFSLTSIRTLIESPFSTTYAFGFSPDMIFNNATLYVPKGTKSLYESVAEWNQFVNIEEIENCSVTLNKDVVTYTSDLKLDFTTPVSGLKAYVVSGVTDGKAVLTEVTGKVPAGTGLILKGTAGETYEIPYCTGDVSAITNKLVGVTVDTAIGGNDVDYILSNGKFVKASAGTLAAGKAYLKLDAALARGTIDIVGDVTGIDALQNNKEESIMNNEVYNLNGQRISKPAKGVYVVDGKKVMVK